MWHRKKVEELSFQRDQEHHIAEGAFAMAKVMVNPGRSFVHTIMQPRAPLTSRSAFHQSHSAQSLMKLKRALFCLRSQIEIGEKRLGQSSVLLGPGPWRLAG